MRSKRLKRECILFCIGIAFFAMLFCFFKLRQRMNVMASFVNNKTSIEVNQDDLGKLVNAANRAVFVTILSNYSDLERLTTYARTTPIKEDAFCIVAASGETRSGILYWDGKDWRGKEIYEPISSTVLNDFVVNETDKSGYSFAALLVVVLTEIVCFVIAWLEEVYGDFMIRKRKHERMVLRSEHLV